MNAASPAWKSRREREPKNGEINSQNMEDKKQIEWYDDVYFLYIFSSIDARMKSEKEYQLPQYAPSPFKKLPSIQGRIRSFELKIV